MTAVEESKRRDEKGSMIIVISIALITSGLVAALLVVVVSGLRGSRSSGDSANALQVADAGVNAAVQFIPTLPASMSTVTPNGPHSVVGGGTYTFSATKVTDQLWNVTSIGRDPSGRERLIKAQAVAVPLFGQPVYVKSLTNYTSGSILESYSDAANICTKKGFLTVEDPLSLKFTAGGGGTANCQRTLLGDASWAYTIDGCRYPGSEEELDDPLPLRAAPGTSSNDDLMGSGRCPLPPNTARSTPKLNLEPNQYPTTTTGVIGDKNTDYVCDASVPTPAGTNYTSLQAGKTYVGRTFTIRRGCAVQGTVLDPAKPTAVYATSLVVGSSSGSSNEYVNPPQAGFKADAASSPCPAYVVGQGGGVVGSTAYCKMWPSMLQLKLVGSAASSTCSSPGQTGCVYLNKQLRYFWGVISAPDGNVRTDGSGMEMWGASVSKAFSADAQFKWYFDDALTKIIGSGRFGVANWREEPLGST